MVKSLLALKMTTNIFQFLKQILTDAFLWKSKVFKIEVGKISSIPKRGRKSIAIDKHGCFYVRSPINDSMFWPLGPLRWRTILYRTQKYAVIHASRKSPVEPWLTILSFFSPQNRSLKCHIRCRFPFLHIIFFHRDFVSAPT